MTIEAIQRDLERTQRSASRSDDRELAIRVREEGHRLVFLLQGLVRAARLYAPDNAALNSLTADLAGVVRRLLDLLGTVHLVWVEDQVFVNEVRIRVRSAEQRVLDQLIADLDRHETGGLSFHLPLDATQARSLAVAIGDAAGPPGAARAALDARLRARCEVEASGRYRFKLKGERPTVARSRHETLLRGAEAIRAASLAVAAGRVPDPLPVRRAAIELIDALWDNPGWAPAAPHWRPAVGSAERHMLSVAGLSLRLGQVLGLADAPLSDLGVSAMLHDVGYAVGGPEASHGASGARALLRQRGFHEGKVRRIRAVLEHHLPHEAERAAGDAAAERPGLFARIIRIADDYDVMVAAVRDAPQVSPAMAQGSMWSARGTAYDPDLLALFVQLLGLYPPGTVVALDDGRLAVSVSGGRDRERFAHPVVRVVRRANGEPLDPPEELDLHELRGSLRPRRILSPATHAMDAGAIVDAAFRSG